MATFSDARKIEEMKLIHKYCEERGGKCLENEYKGSNKKYKCECKNGHEFYLIWNNAKYNNCWCKYCAKNYIDPAKEMELIHKYCWEHSGKCLENEYKGGKVKYKCRCKNGHLFWLTWVESKQKGNWCPICRRKVIDPIEEIKLIHKYCEKRGGKCLENEYKGTRVNKKYIKYLCKCKNEHIFELIWANTKKQKNWCPFCAKKAVDPMKEIKEIHEYCEKRNGKCLENEYKGCAKKYKCICKNGHEFYLNWNKAKTRKDWCKECYVNSLFGQSDLKYAIEQIFLCKMCISEYSFNKLVNDNGNKMFVDIYCEIENANKDMFYLVAEYHGRQHFEEVAKFKVNKNELIKRQRDDQTKKKICTDLNMFYLEVPQFDYAFEYFNNRIITFDTLVEYILEQTKEWCEKNNIPVKEDIDIYGFYKL